MGGSHLNNEVGSGLILWILEFVTIQLLLQLCDGMNVCGLQKCENASAILAYCNKIEMDILRLNLDDKANSLVLIVKVYWFLLGNIPSIVYMIYSLLRYCWIREKYQDIQIIISIWWIFMIHSKNSSH